MVWETPTPKTASDLILTLTGLMRALSSWCCRVPPTEVGAPHWELMFHVERRTHSGKLFVLLVLTWSPGPVD